MNFQSIQNNTQCDPMEADYRKQMIKRLDKLATSFMRQRLFALENLCQKMIDFLSEPFLLKCNTCEYKDYIEWHFNTRNECRECYKERVWKGYKRYNVRYE